MNVRRTCLIAISSAMFVAGAMVPALAGVKWTSARTPTLLAHSSEEESDRSLFAVCASRGVVELYLGADEQVGKGEGEAVRVRLESAGMAATVTGVSRRSANWQMTGGSELVTRIAADDDFFKVLATGRPVKLSGSLPKPATWSDGGMAEAVRRFMKDCALR